MNRESSNSFEEKALKIEKVSFFEGISIIIGAGIGAGILSLAYGAKNAGWPILIIWLIITGLMTTISMLYLAEVTLRTREALQLSGLVKKYVGPTGGWIMFISMLVSTIGAITAYTIGSGEIISSIFGIHPFFGSLLFFIPSLIVIWNGLRAMGVAQKYVTTGMLLLMLIMVIATVGGPGIKTKYLLHMNWYYAIPLFNLVIFNFVVTYTVPELTRGFSKGHIKLLPKAIIVGMVVTGLFLIIIPGAALGLSGPENVTEVLTISWGNHLGNWAFLIGNGIALLAMLTSFWALGESLLTNIFDHFKLPTETNKKHRLIALSVIAIPPLFIVYSGILSFVDILSIVGAFLAPVLVIMPIIMINRSRKTGNRHPEWTCGNLAHPIIQGIIILLFIAAPIYTILMLSGALPSGW